MAKTDKKTETAKNREMARQPTRAHSLTSVDEMDRLFENFIPRHWMHPFQWDMPSLQRLGARLDIKMPSVDIIERDNEIVVKAEMPGVSKEDLEVSFSDNSVTIKGQTSHEEKEDKGDYFRSEIHRGSFSRTVVLPFSVDSDKAKETFREGILELTLPKVE